MLDTAPLHLAALLAIGLSAGLLGGLLGIGGGLVMIPAMLIFLGDLYGPGSFHVFKLAAIATAVVVSLPAATRHHRARAIVYPVLRGVLPLALAGVVIGVVVAARFAGEHTHALRRLFGAFIECLVVWNLYQARRIRHADATLVSSCPCADRHAVFGLVVGLPAGLIAGLLGIGGGAWAVPAQRMFLGVRLRNAIANSSCMIVVVAGAAAAAQTLAVARMPELHPAAGWWLALWLAPGALAGGWCGAGLTHRIPTRRLRQAFYLLLAVTGIRLMFF